MLRTRSWMAHRFQRCDHGLFPVPRKLAGLGKVCRQRGNRAVNEHKCVSVLVYTRSAKRLSRIVCAGHSSSYLARPVRGRSPSERSLCSRVNQSHQPECNCGYKRRRRDGHYPCPDDPPRHPPSHRREPMGRPYADDGSGNGVRGAHGNSS
jgi:hypothetical protein